MTLDDDTDASQRHQGQEERPPLPPRSYLLQSSSIRPPTPTKQRPTLQAKATTAVSSVDIHTLSFLMGRLDGYLGHLADKALLAGNRAAVEVKWEEMIMQVS